MRPANLIDERIAEHATEEQVDDLALAKPDLGSRGCRGCPDFAAIEEHEAPNGPTVRLNP
jgi:hypothetical protein